MLWEGKQTFGWALLHSPIEAGIEAGLREREEEGCRPRGDWAERERTFPNKLTNEMIFQLLKILPTLK